MLLGKRPRQHMRRTTSMTGITVDPPNMDYALEQAHDQNAIRDLHAGVGVGGGGGPQEGPLNDYYDNNMNSNLVMTSSSNGFYDNNTFLASMISPRNHQRLSTGGVGGDHSFVETAHFLRTCGLCKRRLAPGKDIYMYRGDTAFCSLECREQQMKQDERKEKCFVMASSKKDDRRAAASASTTTRSSSSSSSSSKSSSSTKSGAVAAT